MTVLADLPQRSSQVDVTLVTRGITVGSLVEEAGAAALVVRPQLVVYMRKANVRPGDAVEVYFAGPHEELKLPAEISEVDRSDDMLLHLAVTGAPTRSQRRKAVRAHVALPVLVRCQGSQLVGGTVDLSEAGMRVEVDGWGLPPEPGASAEVSVTLGDAQVDVQGVIVRQQDRAGRWELSMQFQEVPETVEDRLRRRVFQALREERARLAD